MKKVDIHVIAFDVPSPPNYGGIIDVYYRLKAFHMHGIKVALHCFDYQQKEFGSLNELVEELNCYPRQMSLLKHFSKIPFIVKSRQSRKLVYRLKMDNSPIWLEGLHSTYLLFNGQLSDRLIYVRTHNVEHDYYSSLSKVEGNPFRRFYYWAEAIKLKHFEAVLAKANAIFALSLSDLSHFKKLNQNTHYLPIFIEDEINEQLEFELKQQAIYHGNLEVMENENAVKFLMQVLENSKETLIVAGRNPRKSLKRRIALNSNVHLVENPSDEELLRLIAESKVACLPTFQKTGIKIKLVKSLILGNQILANNEMVFGTDLMEHCNIANDLNEWSTELSRLLEEEIDHEELKKRRNIVAEKFNNHSNIKKLLELLALAR